MSFGNIKNNGENEDIDNGEMEEELNIKRFNSRESEFERYKRRKKDDNYQFKKKGRNIFDNDKGEDAE